MQNAQICISTFLFLGCNWFLKFQEQTTMNNMHSKQWLGRIYSPHQTWTVNMSICWSNVCLSLSVCTDCIKSILKVRSFTWALEWYLATGAVPQKLSIQSLRDMIQPLTKTHFCFAKIAYFDFFCHLWWHFAALPPASSHSKQELTCTFDFWVVFAPKRVCFFSAHQMRVGCIFHLSAGSVQVHKAKLHTDYKISK